MCELYYCVDGEYKKLGKVENIPTLSAVELENDELANRYVNMDSWKQEIEFKGKLECEGNKNPRRMIMSGGDKGLYNSLTLKEDGYLSPENGWVNDD